MASGYKFYHYDPSLAAAVLFIVLFILTTAAHSYQLLRTRTWFMIPMVIGGYFQWLGYIGRALSSTQTPDWTLGPFVMQTLLLLLAPALFAASIYMELGRVILLTDGERLALIKRRWLTKIFVAGDVISFLAQGTGGGIMAGKKANSQSLGSKIIVVGLFIQLAFFGPFVVVAGLYHRAIKRHPTSKSTEPGNPWSKHLITLYVASVLILIRSIFRTIEYIQGNDGYLLSREVFLYVFDATLMLVVMVIFNYCHPSEIGARLKGGKFFHNGWKLMDLKSAPTGYQLT